MSKKKKGAPETPVGSDKQAGGSESASGIGGASTIATDDRAYPHRRDTTSDGEPLERRGAKWVMLIAIALGMGVASYLTWSHLQLTYSPKTFESFCNFSETFNCDAVNTSDYSELFGLPIALFAIPTYMALAFLVMRSMGRRNDDEAIPLSFVVVISGLTVIASFGLAYISIFQIKAVCLFCISLYLVNIVTFGASLYASRRSPGNNLGDAMAGMGKMPGLVISSLAVLLVTFGVAFAAEQGIKSTMLAATQLEADKQVTTTNRVNTGGGSSDALVTADAAAFGPADAKVTVVEFADFQCGYCKRMSYTLKTLKDEYGDRVRFVFRHFPMSPKCNAQVKNDKHPYACDAARAGICANRQGKFWEFHDLTFKNQRALEREDLLVYAVQVGIDPAQLQSCMADSSLAAVIQADADAMVKALEMAEPGGKPAIGTPRTFINGRLFKGIVPKEVLENAILKELGEAQKAPEPQAKAALERDSQQSPPMVQLTFAGKSFWMDAFEASRGAKGEAASVPDQAPSRGSWYDAKAACEAAGKRLCTQEEWVATCQNAAVVDDNRNGKIGDDLIEGTEFAYSDFYEEGACNDKQERESGRVAMTGNFPRCVTPTGVFDLNGNVLEWVGATEQTAVLMGGLYYEAEKASCFRVQETFGAGFNNKGTGFRCCKD